jgi:hypothetical protein
VGAVVGSVAGSVGAVVGVVAPSVGLVSAGLVSAGLVAVVGLVVAAVPSAGFSVLPQAVRDSKQIIARTRQAILFIVVSPLTL